MTTNDLGSPVPGGDGGRGMRWFRDLWLAAIWDDETLKPNERLVAYVYARYAGSGRISWCLWTEMKRRTGIRSRDAIWRALCGLVAAGWLKEVEKARQHYSARYELLIPTAGNGAVDEVAEEAANVSQESVSRTPDATEEPVDKSAQEAQMSVSRTSDGVEPGSARCPGNGPRCPSPETRGPLNGPDVIDTEVRERTDPGGTLPPDPLRPRAPSGLGTDLPTAASLGSNQPTQVDQVTTLPRTSAYTREGDASAPADHPHDDECPHGKTGTRSCIVCRWELRKGRRFRGTPADPSLAEVIPIGIARSA